MGRAGKKSSTSPGSAFLFTALKTPVGPVGLRSVMMPLAFTGPTRTGAAGVMAMSIPAIGVVETGIPAISPTAINTPATGAIIPGGSINQTQASIIQALPVRGTAGVR